MGPPLLGLSSICANGTIHDEFCQKMKIAMTVGNRVPPEHALACGAVRLQNWRSLLGCAASPVASAGTSVPLSRPGVVLDWP